MIKAIIIIIGLVFIGQSFSSFGICDKSIITSLFIVILFILCDVE